MSQVADLLQDASLTGGMSQVADLLQDPSLMMVQEQSKKPRRNDTFTVLVSGSRFSIVPSLFEKVENLPWQSYRGSVPQLNANPDVFEILLQFFRSGTYPNVARLTIEEATELKRLSELLDGTNTLTELLRNRKETSSEVAVEIATSIWEKARTTSFLTRKPPKKKKLTNPGNNELKSVNSFVRKGAKAKSTKKFDRLPNLVASTSTDSDSTPSGTCDSELIGKSSLQSSTAPTTTQASEQKENTPPLKIRKGLKRVLGNTIVSKSSRKLTHEEWCASEYVS